MQGDTSSPRRSLHLALLASPFALKLPLDTCRLLPTQRESPTHRQRHRRALLRQPSFRRHTRRARQLAVRVPVRNHTLAGDALTVYRII